MKFWVYPLPSVTPELGRLRQKICIEFGVRLSYGVRLCLKQQQIDKSDWVWQPVYNPSYSRD